MKYPRAEQPTSREIAETIERLRNLLFFEYGADNYVFTVAANGVTLASATPTVIGDLPDDMRQL